jgi:hypothetical protein
MNKKLFLLAALLVCVLPLSSFKTVAKTTNAKVKSPFTIVEFGDFIKDGVVYGVYGDPTTHVITSVTELYTGTPVNSFSGTYDGHFLQITGYNASNQYFSYSGTLVWA